MHFELIKVAYAAPLDPQVVALIKSIAKVIINPTIVLFFGIAIYWYVRGLLPMIRQSDDETARANGRMHIMYGTIILAIMLSAWGILLLVANTFGAPPPRIYP